MTRAEPSAPRLKKLRVFVLQIFEQPGQAALQHALKTIQLRLHFLVEFDAPQSRVVLTRLLSEPRRQSVEDAQLPLAAEHFQPDLSCARPQVEDGIDMGLEQ